jgi:hypothetical protein
MILAHEIHHCLLGDEISAFNIKLAPLLPSMGNSGLLLPGQIAKAKINKWRNFSESPIDLSVDRSVKQDWVQVLFPHWKERYPNQFGPGTKYEKAHKNRHLVQQSDI